LQRKCSICEGQDILCINHGIVLDVGIQYEACEMGGRFGICRQWRC
jgi:hypothetical protein